MRWVFPILLGMFLWAFVVAAWLTFAHAADPSERNDPIRGKWFGSLKTSDGHSCCDVSDCNATKADWRDGQWFADVRGLERAIPPEKVLKHPQSIDGEAYVCATAIGNPAYATIYCFIPPSPGY